MTAILDAALKKNHASSASLATDTMKGAAASLAAMDKTTTTTTKRNNDGATGIGGMIGSGIALGATVMFPALAAYTVPMMAAGGAVGGGVEGGMSKSGDWAGGAMGGGVTGAALGFAPTMMGAEGGWAGLTKGAAESLGTATGGALGTAQSVGGGTLSAGLGLGDVGSGIAALTPNAAAQSTALNASIAGMSGAAPAIAASGTPLAATAGMNAYDKVKLGLGLYSAANQSRI